MKKIAGGLTFIFSIVSFGTILFIVFSEDIEWYGMTGLLSLSILPLAGTYYTIKTRFWTDKSLIEQDLEKENAIIKKKIERQELLKKLSSIESNSND